jgi:D-3-phosphoglycerate dehydrogenase
MIIEMALKIAVLDTGYDSFAYEENLFKEQGYEFKIFPGLKSDIEGKIDFAKDAVGLLIRWTLIDERFLDQMTNLKAIVRYGTGYENIDIAQCSERGVRIANVKGYASHSVSDHALALMYSCARALPEGQQQVVSNFGAPPTLSIMEFHERTLGIIGLGKIGGALSTKARHLFKTVLGHDPYIDDKRFPAKGAQKSSFKKVMEESDVISLHCNLTEETQDMIDEKAFRMMRKSPILINTSRGPVVKESALLNALETNTIHYAGLDVFNTELAEELPRPIIEHPRVLATGHYAWYSQRSHQELQKRAAHNLLDLLQDRMPEDCLNPNIF